MIRIGPVREIVRYGREAGLDLDCRRLRANIVVERGADALEAIANRRTIGKVVLLP